MTTQTRKLPFDILDSIRGIAAVYVAIAHCRGVLWIGGEKYMQMFSRDQWGAWEYFTMGTSILTRLAVEFVIVFFVLSGFSIAHSLSANKSPLSFYKRRLIRIYPPYLVALAWAGLVFIITLALFPSWYDGTLNGYAFVRTVEMNGFLEPWTVLRNLLYMPSGGFITPFWSLTYEIIFYALAPFLLRRPNVYVVVSLLFFVLNFFTPVTAASLGLPAYIHQFVFDYNIYFAVGVFLYTHFERISGWFAAYTRKEFLFIFTGLLIIMFAANVYFRTETVFTFIEAAMLSVALIIYFLQYRIRIPMLMKLGKFSYTLYITHFASIYLCLAVYWLIVQPTVPYILNYWIWILSIPFVLLIAYVQYLFVEKRSKMVLNRLRKRASEGETRPQDSDIRKQAGVEFTS